MDGYEHTAAILKALAHPVRLQILDLLSAEGEACVCHLESSLDQRQAYISQQLAKLREAGLVRDRREGLNVFYALVADGTYGLIDDAKELAEFVARADGIGLEFGTIRSTAPDECPCPTCEENLALASSSA